MSTSNKIIKNTLFLYFRMFLIMGVTLYTSRIILNILGVSDYGVYNLVGGIVAMIGFFNASMASATQRYLSYDIGKGDFINLKKTFSTTLTIHILIAIIALIIAETIGLWYVNNIMVLPKERIFAVNIVYQFSILTFIFNIIQVPYNALILARERMKIYSYVSILEVLLKLFIVYLLLFINFDKLIVYSVLSFFIALIIRIIYQIYCRRNFEESKFNFIYDKVYFKELISYSGWNMFGNIASIARSQGNNLVLNIFFGTLVNAAYGITMQVQSAVSMFVTNFQVALNPQIIQTYASGNIQKSVKLMSLGCKYSFFLMLLIVLPILLNINYVLNLWLVDIPDHTVLFVKYSLFSILIDSISGPLMTMTQANGKIKWYQIIVGSLIFLNLPISYILIKYYREPEVVFMVMLIINIISLIFRVAFLKYMVNLQLLSFLKEVILKILIICAIIFITYKLIHPSFFSVNNFFDFIIQCLLISLFTSILIFSLGIDRNERSFVINLLRRKLKNKNN